MARILINVLIAILVINHMACTSNLFVIAEEKANEVSQEINMLSSISNEVEGYEYHLFSPSSYAIFTTISTDYEKSIIVDISDMASVYAYDYVDAINEARIAYDRIQILISRFQETCLASLLFATRMSYDTLYEIQDHILEINDCFNDAERAYRYLYRHRITENGGCVTIGGQEVCPMSE